MMTIRCMYFSRMGASFYLTAFLAGTVCADTVVFKGFEHTSLGSASLELTAENSLRVFNLGDSGSDGVAIDVGTANFINVGTGGEDGKNGSGSTKGKSAFAVSGSIAGVVDQNIGGSLVDWDSGIISIATDYSGVSTILRRVEVWNDGSLVGAFPDYTGEVTYAGDFYDFPLVTRVKVSPVEGIDLRWMAFGGDRLFTVGPHGQFLGDELAL